MQVARGKPCNHQIIFKLFHPDELSGVRKQTTKHNVNIWKGSICAITSNGPAVGLSKRYLTQYRPQSMFFSQKAVPVQGRYGAVFAAVYNMSRHYACRVTKFISDWIIVFLLLFY